MPVLNPVLPTLRRLKRLLLPAVATAALLSPVIGAAGILTQLAPAPVTGFVCGVDFLPMLWSATGDVTAAVSGVDLALGLGNVSTSGCEASDFAGFTAGHIALIQRGACLF